MARIRDSVATVLLAKAQSSVRSDLKNNNDGHHRDDPEHQHFKYDRKHRANQATKRSNNNIHPTLSLFPALSRVTEEYPGRAPKARK
jgi:hypothetical protein